MAFVEMKDVYKRYRTGEIVTAASDGINFTIEKGEFAIIVGPSGAGKTTVLNILGGMDTADEGQVLVDGNDIVQYTPKQLVGYRRHDIGFVFQFYNLVQNLTALENVELAAQICHNPIPAAEALEAVGLGHRLDNFPAQLSGGEQQRVSIARAAQAAAVRRADRRPRLQYRQADPLAFAERLPGGRHDGDRSDAQHRHHPNGRPSHYDTKQQGRQQYL